MPKRRLLSRQSLRFKGRIILAVKKKTPKVKQGLPEGIKMLSKSGLPVLNSRLGILVGLSVSQWLQGVGIASDGF
jgi:hypothetical protein